tara:strand:- start:200 stop:481 length:282 start_codon:yes stop_codon:yes gene_type:complete
MKAEIEIDVYAEISAEGIQRHLYIGDTCEPVFEDVESWEEIVERNIGYYIIPGSNTISPTDLIELDKTVAGLEHAIALFRMKMANFIGKVEDK